MKAYKPYIILFSLFILISFLLPLFSFEGYSILQNTTSHLGAQKAPLNWLMNGSFIALGIVTFVYGKTKTENYPIAKIMIYFFSFSLIGVGLFTHRPLTGEPANLTLDVFHSVFATATGFSFSFFALVLFYIFVKPFDKYLALTLALAAIIIPINMSLFPAIQGLLQRFMFIIAFSWILYAFQRLDQLENE